MYVEWRREIRTHHIVRGGVAGPIEEVESFRRKPKGGTTP